MNNDVPPWVPRCRRPGSRRFRTGTDARGAESQCLHRVRATFIDGARVIRAHGARQRIQALIEDRTLGGIDAAVDLDHAVTDRFDGDARASVGIPGTAHRLRVDVDDHPIHPLGDPLIGQRIPRRCALRQLRIDDRCDVGIGDQSNAVQDDPQHPEIHRTGGEDFGEARQPGDQGRAPE